MIKTICDHIRLCHPCGVLLPSVLSKNLVACKPYSRKTYAVLAG